MHDDSVLVEGRIRRELGERLLPAMYRAMLPMQVEAWDAPGEPVSFTEAMAAFATGAGRPFTVGERWSRPWGTTWFRLRTELPPEWVGRPGTSVEAVIDLGFHPDSAGFQSEGLVWSPTGEPVQGIHPRRTAVPLAEMQAGPIEVIVEAASNPTLPMVGARQGHLGSLATAGERPIYELRQASLALRDDIVFHLLLDIEVLLGLMVALPATDARRQKLLRELEAAFNAIDTTNVGGTAAVARAVLAPTLALHARDGAHRVIAVGHAHIDTAWLWPMRESVRKCARTFASVTRLMDDYPEYRFVCSQAAHYDWMERRYPALFRRIEERVARGQWLPVGAMWVEADMNLPSGESIVRQLVHGQRYFESRFGQRCAEVWLPDVFGYPAGLPQIFRAAGCDRFVTQKLSWNKQNRFPHSTFQWQGLDGSRVLTHFPPVDTYNATVIGEELVFAEQRFKEHGWSEWSLMPFGHGNGGGGPTREMLERARRFADLGGAPRVTQGTPGEFFGHVEAEIAAGAPVPVWDGELYFEMHRGTLTSQARTKVGNRHCERLLREAELWWATGGALPPQVAAELDALWKEVLVQQFHDIIPGSSITWVHADAEAVHERVATRLEALIAEALALVAPAVPALANASSHERLEVVALAPTVAVPVGGPTQPLAGGAVAALVRVPAFGIAPAAAVAATDHVAVTERSFTNSLVSVSWDLDGSITSIIDVRAGREVLPPGRSVRVELAPDRPVEYDAWDVEQWTRGLGLPLIGADSVEVIDAGPLVATLEVRRRFGRSSLVQRLTVRSGSARLDLAFHIDWKEDEQLLSLLVPLDVHAREAACDVQFGHVMRPTHASTSWDAAKFEVCAHRYVDLSEPGFGVAVLNDGRYGHSVQEPGPGGGHGVRVSLLRAAKFPDPSQDHGTHDVTIAILPHGPGLHDVLRAAAALNEPLRVVAPGVAGTAPQPVVTVTGAGVGVSAVKRADDGSGDLIVRLHEACGARTEVGVRTQWRAIEATRCNLLEEPQQGLETGDGIATLMLRPFELVTLRLSRVVR